MVRSKVSWDWMGSIDFRCFQTVIHNESLVNRVRSITRRGVASSATTLDSDSTSKDRFISRYRSEHGPSIVICLEMVWCRRLKELIYIWSWYNYEINRHPFTSWRQFKAVLMKRFGNIHSRGTKSEFVPQYVHELWRFIFSGDRIRRLYKLEGIFLNGLVPEMRYRWWDLRIYRRWFLAVALSMESDIITKVVRKELQEGQRWEYQASTNCKTEDN